MPRPDTRNRQGRFGLSARLLVLTVLFGMIAEVMIYLPSVANYRLNWLTNRISSAVTAALVLEAAPDGMVSDSLSMQILDSVGAKMVALKMSDTKRLLASSEIPPAIASTTDIRDTSLPTSIREAVTTLLAPPGRFIRVIGDAPMHGQFVEIVIDEGPLKQAMYEFSRRLLLSSLALSAIIACLIYLTLSWVIVRPMRRLTAAMMDFGANPEDASRVIRTSRRSDEIGAAERELASMQRQLLSMLQQKSRLAALGLAVSKISHDLRNLLAAAQLFSDRLTTSDDPVVQRFAPKLLQTLDRAIAFCQSTLSYGGATEPQPERRMVRLRPIIADTRELLGLSDVERAGGSVTPPPKGIIWREVMDADLEIDADPDQLSRVLLNLCRNSVQALETKPPGESDAPHLTISARRDKDGVTIDVFDNGPGVSEAARQKLFEAFAGSNRAGGTGLGLAIAAELVRAHGGTLALVENGEVEHARAGTTFRLTIPDRNHATRQAKYG